MSMSSDQHSSVTFRIRGHSKFISQVEFLEVENLMVRVRGRSVMQGVQEEISSPSGQRFPPPAKEEVRLIPPRSRSE